MDAQDRAAHFAALAAELQAEPDEQLTSRAIVQRLVEVVSEADEASLTVRTRRGHRTLASSDELADLADGLQYALGEGPCIATADDAATTWLRSGDVAADHRWPHWGPEAGRLGVGSLLSVQLLDGDEPRGALNLYSRTTGAFADHDTIDVALIYAIHAANALSAARLATGMQTALSTRHTIGMAQGILIERFGLTEQRAFELLRRLSSTGEVKLRDVAAHIVRTGTLPDAGTGPAQERDQP